MSKRTVRRAYSYVRFSSPQQAEGGSLDRQVALARAYCERKGLTLDGSLTLHDLGCRPSAATTCATAPWPASWRRPAPGASPGAAPSSWNPSTG